MMREIEIDTGILQRDIQEMETALKNARKNMQEMMDRVYETADMWQGSAQMEFVATVRKDYQDMKELCKHVDNLINCMRSAKKEYNLCEDNVGSIIDAIRI